VRGNDLRALACYSHTQRQNSLMGGGYGRSSRLEVLGYGDGCPFSTGYETIPPPDKNSILCGNGATGAILST